MKGPLVLQNELRKSVVDFLIKTTPLLADEAEMAVF